MHRIGAKRSGMRHNRFQLERSDTPMQAVAQVFRQAASLGELKDEIG